MKKSKITMLLLTLSVSIGSVLAQSPKHENYILRESKTQKFYDRYTQWEIGEPLFSDEAAEDEEFFISRVRPRTRFTNVNTQVNTALDGQRKLIWWCPIGTPEWNALPTYQYNSEVFSMWNYLDHYGNWTASFVRSPGAFTDVCHKNGVTNSVLASVPFGVRISATEENFGKTFNALSKGGADKLLKFLKYYGIDGLGFNSEFNFDGATFRNDLNKLFVDAFKKKDAAGLPNFAMAWYSLTGNNGTIRDGSWDSLNKGNKNWFDNNGTISNYFFLNYNWGSSDLNGSQNLATSLGRSSYDVYAGMNFQGSGHTNWSILKNYDISIGIWGAHSMNMIYESRGELGADPTVQQQAYQLKSEVVFTGGTHNPVNTSPISDILTYSANNKDFHGMSKFLNARSTLHTDDLAKDPFVTYFNLGNGTFFNVKGETTFPNEWYNLGMQDYLPTWRWWITKSFMGRDANEVPTNGIKAQFTWEDAWFGGSCLKVSGESVETNYLHLFKTQYPLKEGDKVTVRYKILHGTGDIKLSASAEGTESQEVTARIRRSAETDKNIWVEKEILVGAHTGELNMAGRTLALLALKFTQTTTDFEMLIGEMSVVRETATTPKTPIISKSKILKTNFRGVDFKVIYQMEHSTSNSPIYNDDVDTWYYKIYAQQRNEEPILCTTTTSWAGYVVGMPFDTKGENSVRIGVSAVSLDGNSESKIAWTEFSSTTTLEIVEGIEKSKPITNPNEELIIKYKDPNHANAQKWVVENSMTGEVVAEYSNSKSITVALSNIGQYDLKITDSKNNENIYRGYIQVVGESAGAVPQIKELTANNKDKSFDFGQDTPLTYAYTAKNSNGAVSRALRLPEKAFCVKNIVKTLDLTMDKGGDKTNGLTVSFWFKSKAFNHEDWGTQLLNIRSLSRKWPFSDWGYFWSSFGSSFSNGFYDGFHISKMYWNTADAAGTLFPVKYEMLPNTWYHICFVISANQDITLYLNGRKMHTYIRTGDSMKNILSDDHLFIGGKAFKRSGFDGYIDEVKLFNKALANESDVQATMNTYANPSKVQHLVGYWNFEGQTTDGQMPSIVNGDKVKASIVQVKTKSEGENYLADDTNLDYGASAPSITGDSYKIITLQHWKLDGATIVKLPTQTATSGNVEVKYLKNGLYSVVLTLKNDWGQDKKQFQFVRVGDLHKITYSSTPADIHTNNYKILYANPGSQLFNPVVSGNSYPDGISLKLEAKTETLDDKYSFKSWVVNGTKYQNNIVEIPLVEETNILVKFVEGTGVITHKADATQVVFGPNPFVNEIHISFAQQGKYQVEFRNLQGVLISKKDITVQKNELTTFGVEGEKGTYLLTIKKENQIVKTFKLIKK